MNAHPYLLRLAAGLALLLPAACTSPAAVQVGNLLRHLLRVQQFAVDAV
ncbi:hypothetical protein HKT23_29650, partial [Pseudomonas aeruginosa]|nr:hypothetical protein [Pseudomonas aeruginosa]